MLLTTRIFWRILVVATRQQKKEEKNKKRSFGVPVVRGTRTAVCVCVFFFFFFFCPVATTENDGKKTAEIFRKNLVEKFFRRQKIENCKSFETRFAEVSRRSELCLGGERSFEVRHRRPNFVFFVGA